MYSLEYADTVRKSDTLCEDAKAWTPSPVDLDPDAIEGAVAKIEEMPTRVDYRATRNEREANILAAIEAKRKDPNSAVVPLTVVVAHEVSGVKNLFLAAAAKKRAA